MYVRGLNLICEIVVKPNGELYRNVHAICDFVYNSLIMFSCPLICIIFYVTTRPNYWYHVTTVTGFVRCVQHWRSRTQLDKL